MTDRAADHLSLDTLAELAEHLLDEPQAAAAEQHLASCADCQARQAALRDVPALLAAAADPGPLPADVAHRLETALATETRASSPASAVTPLPPRSPDRTGWGMRILQAAAAVVLLLAGTGVVVSGLGIGPDRNPDRTTTQDAGSAAAPEAGDARAYPVTASGRNWDRDSLLAAAPALIRGELGPRVNAGTEAAPLATSESSPARDSSALRLAGGEPLATCVGRLNLGPATPLAVDLGSWEGNPAAVIVLPSPGAPTEADIYVVAPDCPAGQFLFYAHVARP